MSSSRGYRGLYGKAVIRMRYYVEIRRLRFFFLFLLLPDLINHRFVTYTSTNSVGKHDRAMYNLRASELPETATGLARSQTLGDRAEGARCLIG